jgi:hypothetical protein
LKHFIAQRWTKAAHGTRPIIAFEASFARDAPFHFSLRRKALLFAFKNDSHVRDSQWVRVHPCIDFVKNLSGQLAILFLCSNASTSVNRHDVLGKHSLVRDPTGLMTNESSFCLQRVIRELKTMRGLFISQVV